MPLNKYFYQRCSGFFKNYFQKKSLMFGILLVLSLTMVEVCAESQLELDKTEITGARELPKVLYIVPWKKTAPDPRPLPMRSLIDEALAPIDIDVFRRQVRYHEMARPPSGEISAK